MSDEKEVGDVSGQVDAGKKEVDKLVATGNLQQALHTALGLPTAKDEKIKLTLTQTVVGVLSGVKEADIGKTLDALSADERVNAMKFVYRGMATGQNCTQLLKWHSAIYDKDGAGSIMRVLVDRNL